MKQSLLILVCLLGIATNARAQDFCRGTRIAGSRHGLLREEVPIDVRDPYRGLRGANVRYENGAAVIEPEKGRPSPAGQAADRSVNHPLFLNQLFGD